jgi:multiple sugar transport system substrate-binding protein
MRMSRRSTVVTGTLAAIAFAATFGTAPARADTVLNLVVADYGNGPADTSQIYWQKIADDFHAANPAIMVKVQTISWNDFDTKVQTMVQNREYPDITEGDYFSNYAQEGLLYKVSDVFSDPDNLMPVFKQLGSYGGVQYGLPFTTSARALFYNKAIFAEAGITTPPATWDEIATDAAKIEAKGKIGFGLPLGPEEAQAETLLWFLGNGGGYQDAAGKWVIDSPQNVETLQFMTKLVKAGDTEPNPGTKNRTELFNQFAQGQIGMMNGEVALLPIINSAGVLKTGDLGTAPIAGKTGPIDKTLGVCDFVAAFKGDGTKQAAIKTFLDFAFQDKYQLAFVHEYLELPGTTSAAVALAKTDATLAPFVKALPNAVQYPNDPVWAQVKVQIQQIIGTAIGPDPQAVLGRIQQTALKGS